MPEADLLIQHYLEGTLSEADAVILHDLLIAEPELGDQLLQHFELDEMLRATRPLTVVSAEGVTKLPQRRFTMTTLTGVAAIAACLALLVSWVVAHLADREETTASVAVLTRGVNMEWESAAVLPGTPLSPGWLRLKSGLAQIEFYQGARVLMEGPAALQIVSSGEATCVAGKLSAHVPPQAKGFRINTPKGTIVDLGTEFGLDVSATSAEVHVFKGEIELHQPTEAMQSLREGQAIDFGDHPRRLPANAAGFAALNELDERTLSAQRALFAQWQTSGLRLNLDPSLRLRFDFQDAEGARSLLNRATNCGPLVDGSIVGATWTSGRWPGKQALDFRNVSDRVRLQIPGEVSALTLSVWVRVYGLDRVFNSLFMSEGWGDRKVHWQITREGVVRLGVAGSDGARHRDYDGPVFFKPERIGQWTHLAVVFDPDRKEVRHYADGDRLATLKLIDATPLKIGMAELGNWNDRRNSGGVAIRHLSGAMDEFALWDRVLRDDEIAALAK